MKEHHREFLKKLLYYSGYSALYEFVNSPADQRLLILMYHDIVSEEDQRAHWFNSDIPSTTQMEALIVALKQHYRIISVEDAIIEIRETGAVQTKSVAITFDDGYVSTYKLLYPLLKKHGVTATIYLPTDWIDGKIDLWWITLAQMIDQSSLTSPKISTIEGILGESLTNAADLTATNDRGKRIFHESVSGILMRRGDGARDQIIHDLQEVLLDGRPFAPERQKPLSWEQIEEMSKSGVRFGAHTCSHPNLSHIDLESADHELGESKRIIQERLNIETLGLAYPYGYDVAGYRRLVPLLEKHGYHYACTSWWGHVDSKSNRYLLGRTSLPQSNSSAVLARTIGLEYCMKHWPPPPGLEQWPIQNR